MEPLEHCEGRWNWRLQGSLEWRRVACCEIPSLAHSAHSVMRWGELSFPLTSPCSIWESRPPPWLDSVVGLALVQRAGLSQPQGYKGEMASPLLCHEVAWVMERGCHSPPCPLPPEAVERANLRVMREGEQVLPPGLLQCSESGLCTSPGQQSSAGHGGSGTGEPAWSQCRRAASGTVERWPGC